MKFLKRLAAGLLAGVMAASTIISAGAVEGGIRRVYDEHTMNEDGREIWSGEHFCIHGNGETIETLTDVGTIKNVGNAETEVSVLIPPSVFEKYPAGTVALVTAKSDGEDAPFFVRDGKREDLFQGQLYAYERPYLFIVTSKMKENGILFSGYELWNQGELSEVSTIVIQSVEFTNAVAAEYEQEYKTPANSQAVPIAIAGVERTGLLLNENGSAKITTEELKDAPVGSYVRFRLDTTKIMAVNETYIFDFSINGKLVDGGYYDHSDNSVLGDRSSGAVYQDPLSITDTSNLSEEAKLFNHRAYNCPDILITEDMKTNGMTIAGPSDVYIPDYTLYIPSENSEIIPVKPTEKTSFSTPTGETSVNEVPVGTVVTQKTAVADGLYSERFIQKVAAADIVGKTKATFTLSNGTVTETVTTTRYNTALTVDGETVSAGSGYVYLVYTLSGIPADVSITVSGVTLA